MFVCLWGLPSLLPAAEHTAETNSIANNFGYTEEHPLIIVGDWDFRPFEFVNTEGKPSGYNVEVIDLILDQLNIPHKFVMEDWHMATDMFKKRDADLIQALYYFFKDPPYVSTQKYINYYNLKVARRADVTPLKRLGNLRPADTLLVKEDDYGAMTLEAMKDSTLAWEYHSPKEGLTGIKHGRYKYYIWGEIPLSHKIQELRLDSIVLDEIDIPAGELRIIGYNKELVDVIDEQYTRLEQMGELQKIYDHWFHPEREQADTSPVALFILAGLLLTTIIVILLTRLVRRSVEMKVRESSDLQQMMDQVLNMGDYFVVEWDLKSNMLRNQYGDLLPDGEMEPDEFISRLPQEEAQQLHQFNGQLFTGTLNHFDMNLDFNEGTHEQPVWRNFYGNAIIERGKDGKPQYILYTAKDITQEVKEGQRIKNNANKYKKMFDTNLIAMSFYDTNGTLLDYNKKMHEVYKTGNNLKQYFRNTTLFNYPPLKGIYMPGSRETMHVCQHIDEPELGLNKYLEFRVQPVINDDGELIYYIVTCREVTAERDMYLAQREHNQKLHATTESIKRYEKQLGYLLEESLMYIWTFHPSEGVINMTRSPGQTEFSESLEGYMHTITPEAREKAMEEVLSAMQKGKPYNTLLPFDYTPLDKQFSWYAISGIPIFNKEGQLTEYFGLSRNVTELMEAQQQLRVETKRAEDSGKLKAAFLANMTHEIRTPLNAIVGFSDVLPMVSDSNERQELLRIIRNNCDMLLRLINDILEASDIDSRPMAIEPKDVDFAKAFDDICQTVEQRVQETGVEFIKDNPYTTFPTRLDKGRMQQVITNFVTNAIKYTHQGHIRVGYRQETRMVRTKSHGLSSKKNKPQDGIYIYCEDTGAGIPKDKQASVFERFVKLNEFIQGTGLGLSICKSIADRCGGEIGVDSEGEGHGSTFWIWIPCIVPKQ